MKKRTPAQHIGEAYEADVGQFKGAAVTGLQELLTEVQAHAFHLINTDKDSGSASTTGRLAQQ